MPSSAAFSMPAPLTAAQEILPTLRQRGYAVLSASDVSALTGAALPGLLALAPSWESLVADAYLRDGGRYRRRRHACWVVEGSACRAVPHRAHWQPVAYNALHGGLARWFEPVTQAVSDSPAWHALITGLARVCTELRGEPVWFVEAHQFRIDTTDGIGRPTPEGAHRDGVDFVAVLLVAREGIKGGETRVFEAAGPHGIRFTLAEPWSLLMLDDERVIHESTPIQPLHEGGHRDTLVLTFRRGGFQGPQAEPHAAEPGGEGDA